MKLLTCLYFRSAFLRRVNILKHLSDYQVAKLGQVAERQTYRKHQCVVRQNAIGNGLYIILSGKCKVFKTIENVETVIAELTDGDYFGEKELKSEHVRNGLHLILLAIYY